MVVSPTFYNCYVKLPSTDQTPPEIRDDPKLYPFFKDCRGAIDGTHIEAFVPDEAMARYRNHKGYLPQNVLTNCENLRTESEHAYQWLPTGGR